ncbi:hypothetical protein ACH5RR_009038 [Cinchona calisaya]|uniref:Uncharacterized protein n=1 Tax=Cinchona calisaya TaxID=153742 RepID=A0ABD3AD62_9GENT
MSSCTTIAGYSIEGQDIKHCYNFAQSGCHDFFVARTIVDEFGARTSIMLLEILEQLVVLLLACTIVVKRREARPEDGKRGTNYDEEKPSFFGEEIGDLRKDLRRLTDLGEQGEFVDWASSDIFGNLCLIACASTFDHQAQLELEEEDEDESQESEAITLLSIYGYEEEIEGEDEANNEENSSLALQEEKGDEVAMSLEPEEKISKFLRLKKIKSYNAEVHKRKEYQNPDFLWHAMIYHDIDEIGSCFSEDVFDPHGYNKSDFHDVIEVDTRLEMERKEQEKKQSPKIDFLPAGT